MNVLNFVEKKKDNATDTINRFAEAAVILMLKEIFFVILEFIIHYSTKRSKIFNFSSIKLTKIGCLQSNKKYYILFYY